MRYGSVCSGVEAASVAWRPLGWTAAWLAEIEKFPSKVLAHHYPSISNVGDMRKIPGYILAGLLEAPDVLVGGTPCQAFSVAGLRNSLEDDRGQLSITFIHIADAIDRVRDTPCVVVWENVPGVLNTKDNAFGCFLAGLVGEEEPLQPPRGRWTDAGYVSGPTRSAAWRILDAQYFGVAQRRRRVFVVAGTGDGFDPTSVLFESEGVRRDTPPSRKTGEGAAGTLASRTNGGGFPGSDEAMSGYVQPVNTTGAGFWREGFGTLRAREQESHEHLIVGGVFQQSSMAGKGTIGWDDSGIAKPVKTQVDGQMVCMSTGQAGAEIGIGIGTTLNCNHEAPIVAIQDGRGLEKAQNGKGWDDSGVAHTLDQTGAQAVCQYGPLAGALTARHDSSPCADRGMNVVAFHHDAQVDQMNFNNETTASLTTSQHAAIAFKPGQSASARSIGAQEEIACTLESAGGGNNKQAVSLGMQVRRLTPVECERLQGFPDDYTNIPSAADGPRYKALGNSMAVPVMAWIGRRIADVI